MDNIIKECAEFYKTTDWSKGSNLIVKDETGCNEDFWTESNCEVTPEHHLHYIHRALTKLTEEINELRGINEKDEVRSKCHMIISYLAEMDNRIRSIIPS